MTIDYVLLAFITDGKVLVFTYTADKKMKNAKQHESHIPHISSSEQLIGL
jgi:hypothetical protein